MAINRADALLAERNEVVRLCGTLSEEEWSTPSRCEGWTVRDVVAHMGAACHGTFTPWVVKLMFLKDLEAGNDRDVAKREKRSSAEVFGEYEKWSKRFIGLQRPLQHAPLKGTPVRLGEMGVYPAWMLTAAIVFDTHVHLRYDIATVLGRFVPETSADRVATMLEWMMAGLPNMSGGRLDWVDRPIAINLVGPGGATYYVHPGKKNVKVTLKPVEPVATIEANAVDFVIWGTRRESWQDHDVKLLGDEGYGKRFLEDFQVI